MHFVCPNPNIWNKIYQNLLKAWDDAGAKYDKPPTPLILAGWWASSDFDKQARWKETIQWADVHGLSNIIPDISPDDCYSVDVLSHEVIDGFPE